MIFLRTNPFKAPSYEYSLLPLHGLGCQDLCYRLAGNLLRTSDNLLPGYAKLIFHGKIFTPQGPYYCYWGSIMTTLATTLWGMTADPD
jgi:hypothetical protein